MSAPAASQYNTFTQKTVHLGDVAPNFQADTTNGHIDFHQWAENKWVVFFSHPADFTPVCTTELGRVAQLEPEFSKRNAKVIALSVDTVEHHKQWLEDIKDITSGHITYPVIADPDRKISCLYGMLNQDHYDAKGLPFTVRAVFILDPAHKVRLTFTYPASTGRNFDEILRVLDSLQLADNHKVATPADWTKGKECVVLPFIPTDEAIKLFPKGVKVVRPWLRLVSDPSADDKSKANL